MEWQCVDDADKHEECEGVGLCVTLDDSVGDALGEGEEELQGLALPQRLADGLGVAPPDTLTIADGENEPDGVSERVPDTVAVEDAEAISVMLLDADAVCEEVTTALEEGDSVVECEPEPQSLAETEDVELSVPQLDGLSEGDGVEEGDRDEESVAEAVLDARCEGLPVEQSVAESVPLTHAEPLVDAERDNTALTVAAPDGVALRVPLPEVVTVGVPDDARDADIEIVAEAEFRALDVTVPDKHAGGDIVAVEHIEELAHAKDEPVLPRLADTEGVPLSVAQPEGLLDDDGVAEGD